MTMAVTTTNEDTDHHAAAQAGAVEHGLWRISDVRQHFKCSAMWIWRKTREANFPKAIKFGGPRSARFWRRDDVLRWADQYALRELAQEGGAL